MSEKEFERGLLGKYSLEEKNEDGKLWKILKHEKTVSIYINYIKMYLYICRTKLNLPYYFDPPPTYLELRSIAIVTAVWSVFFKG